MISVIGGGPAGCQTAHLLAKAGQKVNLYEEHPKIGEPVQCTGILTKDIEHLIKLKKSTIANRIKKIRVVSPSNSAEIKIKSPEYILWRNKLDQQLADSAENEGVKIFTGHRLKKITSDKLTFSAMGSTLTKKRDILIGADGPRSAVAAHHNLLGRREFYIGVQYVVEGNFEPNTYNAYFGKHLPQYFGWLVPENESRARIGIGAKKGAQHVFDKFAKKELGDDYKKKVVECQGGVIPVFNPAQKVQLGNTYLVGDAATHSKSTTGGGIIPGLRAAGALADSISNDRSYKFALRDLHRSLHTHYLIRKTLDRFSPKDYDRLVEMTKHPASMQVLESESRDNAVRLSSRLLIRRPGYLRFAPKGMGGLWDLIRAIRA